MNLEELEQAYAELGQKIKNLKQKPKRFPQVGEKYWYYDHLFEVYWFSAFENSPRRAFKTEGEAQQAAEIEKAKIELKYIIEELNDGWVPDFSLEVSKFCLYFDTYDKSLQINLAVHEKCQPTWMYLKSANLAQRLIANHSELLKIVLSEQRVRVSLKRTIKWK